MNKKLLQTLGAYSAAKVDFLSAANGRIDPETGNRGGIGVNRRHCRPLKPHGARMIRDGLMILIRMPSLSMRCSHSALVITDAGVEELARLEKRIQKAARRHEGGTALIHMTRSKIPGRRGLDLMTKAIAYSKAAHAQQRARA